MWRGWPQVAVIVHASSQTLGRLVRWLEGRPGTARHVTGIESIDTVARERTVHWFALVMLAFRVLVAGIFSSIALGWARPFPQLLVAAGVVVVCNVGLSKAGLSLQWTSGLLPGSACGPAQPSRPDHFSYLIMICSTLTPGLPLRCGQDCVAWGRDQCCLQVSASPSN